MKKTAENLKHLLRHLPRGLLIACCSLACLTAYSQTTAVQSTNLAQNTAADWKDEQLGMGLLQELVHSPQHASKNIMIAPRNIRSALAAVATGAEGTTRSEITALTGNFDAFDNSSGEIFKNTWHLWVLKKKGVSIQPEFSARLPHVRIDTSTVKAAPGIINRYVAQQTSGKIKKVLKELQKDTEFVLTAIFDFEGKWQYPFRPEATQPRLFYPQSTPSHKVPFMRHDDLNVRYAETARGQMIQLPYKGSDRLVLTIFLPAAGLNAETWLAQTGGKEWPNMVAALDFKKGTLMLPRLKSAFEAGLNEPLKALGINTAFSDDAKFTGILTAPYPLKISNVLHQTTFDMDEQGTKAAAVTVIEMRAPTAIQHKPEPVRFNMEVDRPFFLTIGDASNHKIYFMGLVRNIQP